MRNYIINTYNEFLNFMNIDKKLMPILTPIENMEEINKNVIAFVNNDEIQMPTTNVYYNPHLLNGSDDYIKSKLFHEFTHVLDYFMLCEKYDTDQLNAILATYSEFHASQVELLRNIGFSNIRNIRKLDVDKTYVSYENSKHTLTDDYVKPLADSSLIISKPSHYYYTSSAVDYFSKYKQFEAKTMYYLGKQSVCFMLSQEPIANITDSIYGEFSTYIRKIEQLIKNRKYDKLKEARNELWTKYTLMFPCLDNAILPQNI